MKKLQFKITINAQATRVYDTMLGINNRETYNLWTAEFNPSSTWEGSWEKGAKILFIGTDDEGRRGGMVAKIEENVPNRFVSIRHYGILDGNNEIIEGADIEKWSGGLENYTFDQIDGATTVTVDIDVPEDYFDYFAQTWPAALNKLKVLSES